jgi:hypothetical protein
MRKILVLLALFVFVVFPVSAQGETVARFFFVDIVQNGIYRSPAHFGGRFAAPDPELAGIIAYYHDYGLVNQAIVYIPSLPPDAEIYLDNLPDVLGIPANLETVIGAGSVAAIRSALEARDIPGTWIGAGDTYRQAMRETFWVFDVMQDYTTFAAFNPIAAGINLNTTMGNVAVAQWTVLRDRWNTAKTEIDPDTITELTPDGFPYDKYTAWSKVVSVEAANAGMSLANIRKCALMVLVDNAGYDVSPVTSSTTFGQILRGIGNAKTNQAWVWAGAGVTI